MRNEGFRNAAPYIALFGLFILAAALVLSTTAAAATLPEYVVPGLAIVGAVLLAVWPIARPEDIRSMLASRQARFGGNALMLTLSAVGILVVLNYFATLRYETWDLTENQQFTLSRQTVQIVQDLEQPVEVFALFQSGSQGARDLEQLVEQYRKEGADIDLSIIDPQVEPVEFQVLADRVDQPSSALPRDGRGLIAISGGRDAVVRTGTNEEELTEAIVKATRERDLRVWFTTGHGEFGLDENLTQVRGFLEAEGYTVEAKSLNQMTETLTTDLVQAVVVPGPQQPFTEQEVERLTDYVDSGGSVMLMLPPMLEGEATTTGLESLLDRWGIVLHDDLVIDPSHGIPDGEFVALVGTESFSAHSITEPLMGAGLAGAFPVARSMEAGTAITTSLTAQPLITTHQATWGETDVAALTSGEQIQLEQDADDNSGPLTIAMAGQGGESGRIVVFGSAQFVTDSVGAHPIFTSFFAVNANLFANAVNWLTLEEDLIAIRPTPPEERPLAPATNPIYWLLPILLLPLTVIGIGALIWWERR